MTDTSVFIARETGRPINTDVLPDELAVSAITVGELRLGVLAAEGVEERDRRLATLTQVLAMKPVAVDECVAEAWAKLRVLLRDAGEGMPVNDSWIAATALSLDVPVVTQDHDYVELPELPVIKV